MHATANLELNVQEANYDYVMCGEGGEMLPQLMHYINGEQQQIPKGVWSMRNERIQKGGHSDFVTELDKYPLLAYYLIDYSKYAMKAERKNLDGLAVYSYVRILISRRCPYNYCFCQVNIIIGRVFRLKSAENILTEIDWLINTYGIQSLIFDDDNLLTDRIKGNRDI